MRALDEYPLSELKHIYRVLHAQLAADAVLVDSDLLHDLQTWLQRCAKEAGVRVTEHAQWDAWLHDRPSDAFRPGAREPLK